MKKIMLALAIIFLGNIVFAQQNNSNARNISVSPQTVKEEQYKINTQKGNVIIVPAGQTFKAIFTTPLNSASASVGQVITMVLGKDYYYKNICIASAGSSVKGSIIEASNAKHGSINGKIAIRYTQITTPSGQVIPISAVIKTEDYSGVLVGGSNNDNNDSDKGAIADMITSPSAATFGKGNTLSGAVGAGGGLVKSIWDKGEDVSIPANSSVDLILLQPITVSPVITEN